MADPKLDRRFKQPVDRARAKLSQTVRAPIRRLDALAHLIRERDLTPDEFGLMARDIEALRTALRVMRKEAANGV